jgi:hypothetical protein
VESGFFPRLASSGLSYFQRWSRIKSGGGNTPLIFFAVSLWFVGMITMLLNCFYTSAALRSAHDGAFVAIISDSVRCKLQDSNRPESRF